MINTYWGFCIIMLLVYLIVVYTTAAEEGREDKIVVPNWLRNILFPLLKRTEISLLAVLGAGYMELSFIIISIVYFTTKNIHAWKWSYIYIIQFMIFVLITVLAACVTGVINFNKAETKKDKLRAIIVPVIMLGAFGMILLYFLL